MLSTPRYLGTWTLWAYILDRLIYQPSCKITLNAGLFCPAIGPDLPRNSRVRVVGMYCGDLENHQQRLFFESSYQHTSTSGPLVVSQVGGRVRETDRAIPDERIMQKSSWSGF